MTSPIHRKSISASSVRPLSYPLQKPYPYVFKNQPITIGFGRGSSELGIPTANVPINQTLSNLQTGVYYGWCKIIPQHKDVCFEESTLHNRKIEFNYGKNLQSSELEILPMVMSVGWNPTYDDLKEKAVEIHIIHNFETTFYGALLDYIILGFLRPELEFKDIETLKLEINQDITITTELLNKEEQLKFKEQL